MADSITAMYPRCVKWIFAVAFMDLFAVSLIMPLMSAHLKSLGASHFLIGLLGSTYACLQLFSGPVVGSWSDIRGRRSALLFTLFICCVCYFSMGFVKTMPVLFFLRIVLGLVKHTQSLCKALVADVVPPDQQPAVGGRLTSFSSMGFMVGPALGGHLFEADSGFSFVCIIVAVLFTFNVGIVYMSLPRTTMQQRKDHGVDSEERLLPARQELIRAATELAGVEWSQYWDVFLQKFLAGLAMANFFAHYSLIIKERYGMSPSWVGYTISFQGFVSVTSGFLMAKLDRLYASDETCNLRTFHSFLILSLSFVFLSYAPSLGVFFVGLVPLSASASLLRLVGNDIIIKRTQPDKRGSLVGAGNSVSSISRLLSPLIAGIIYDVVGDTGVFIFSIFIAGVGVLLSYCLLYQEKQLIKTK